MSRERDLVGIMHKPTHLALHAPRLLHVMKHAQLDRLIKDGIVYGTTK